jgi:hypothetical protein
MGLGGLVCFALAGVAVGSVATYYASKTFKKLYYEKKIEGLEKSDPEKLYLEKLKVFQANPASSMEYIERKKR